MTKIVSIPREEYESQVESKGRDSLVLDDKLINIKKSNHTITNQENFLLIVTWPSGSGRFGEEEKSKAKYYKLFLD